MSTVYFLFRSTKKQGPLTVRYQHKDKTGKRFQFHAKTNLEVTKQYWEKTRLKKRNLKAEDKKEIAEVNKELSKIEAFILAKTKNNPPNPTSKNWLKDVLDLYYNPEETSTEAKSDLFLDCVQDIIDNSSTRVNATGGIGISDSRVNSYRNLHNIFKKYQGTKRYKVEDIDYPFSKKFLQWMLNKRRYSEGYAKKKIDDLKTVCLDAETYGIKVSPQLRRIKGGKTKKDYIIYLTPEELSKIERLDLSLNDTLDNVRKWLLLGCNIGQRGSDLLKLAPDNFVRRNGLDVIELKQKKTKKDVTIPLLKKTRQILQDGLPKKIAIQNFNTQLKKLCEIAKIDTPTKGEKTFMVDEKGKIIPKNEKGKYIKKGESRKIEGVYPKYELIASHVCRRSFATNHYGELPTQLIIQVTGHSTETQLLNYIGKSSIDYAQQIANFYSENDQFSTNNTTLKIIRNTAS